MIYQNWQNSRGGNMSYYTDTYPGPYYINDFDEVEYARLFNGDKFLTCKFTKDFGRIVCDTPAP